MNATTLVFRGEQLLLDPDGVLVWPRMALLAVADLHLEKGSACARRGQLLPPWDSQATLAQLERKVTFYRPQIIVAAGDSFHDREAASRLAAEDFAVLAGIARAAHMVWVTGNHDPAPPCGLPGDCAALFSLAPLVFRHQAAPGAQGEISGHFHPKARVATRVGEIVRPCFLADADRIMMPAFGAYTGGLDIRSPSIASLYPQGGSAFLLGQKKLFRFALPPAAPAAALAARQAAHKFP